MLFVHQSLKLLIGWLRMHRFNCDPNEVLVIFGQLVKTWFMVSNLELHLGHKED